MKSWRQFKKEQGIVECDYAMHELSNGACLCQPDIEKTIRAYGYECFEDYDQLGGFHGHKNSKQWAESILKMLNILDEDVVYYSRKDNSQSRWCRTLLVFIPKHKLKEEKK